MSNSTIDTIDTFVRSFVQIYVLLILVWVVLGYFRLPYNVWLSRIRHFLDDTVQPYLRLWRRILPMFGPLETADGYVMVAVASEKTFKGLMGVIGRPEWISDPRFSTYAARRDNWADLMDGVEAWSRQLSTERPPPPLFPAKAGTQAEAVLG